MVRIFLCVVTTLATALVQTPSGHAAEGGWLGVDVYSLTKVEAARLGWLATRGAKVLLPIKGAPADKAGITTDDIILSINDMAIESSEALVRIVSAVPAKSSVRLKIDRSGQEQVLTVVLTPRPKNVPSHLPEIRDLAARGHPRAMATLGQYYRFGKEVPQDFQQARSWYARAIAAGDASAFSSLGWLYENGFGGEVDYEQALRLYEKGISVGDAYAMNNLGVLYDKGRGVRQDLSEAKRWYERAAALGNAFAMNNLGFMYEEGKGVTRDVERARSWHRRAIAAGSDTAEGYLRQLDAPKGRSRETSGSRARRGGVGRHDAGPRLEIGPRSPGCYQMAGGLQMCN